MKVFFRTVGVLSAIASAIYGIILAANDLLAASVMIWIAGAISSVTYFALAKILSNQEEILSALYSVSNKIYASQSSGYSANRDSSYAASVVKNIGNTWTCPECGEINPITQRNCKGCGHDK